MKGAATVALVLALGVAAAAPALRFVPELEPVPATAWGHWSALALEPQEARAQALGGLRDAVRAGGVGVIIVAALTALTLLIARAAERRSEIRVRRAVGASRRALAGAAVAEGAAIAAGALAVGAAIAALQAAGWRRAWPAQLQEPMAPLLWLGALAAVAVLGALLPLWFARGRAPGSDGAAARVPLVVPAVQLAVALLGLVAAARLAGLAPAAVPGASAPDSGVVLRVALRGGGQDAPALDAALRRLRQDPTVSLASVSSPGTLIGLGHVDLLTTECGRCAQGGLPSPLRVVQATHHLASADTFRALNLPLVAGRAFGEADRRGAPPVAVVNRYLAERYFEGGRAVGKRVRVGGPADWYHVVGIVEDAGETGIGAGRTPRARLYLPAWQHDAREVEVLIRSATGAGPVALARRLTGAGMPPRSLRGVMSETAMWQREAAATRWFARVVRWSGWGTLVLSTLGLIAVVRLWIAGALPELALRRAVGARRMQVLGRIGARVLAIVAAGLGLAWWLDPVAAAALPRVPAGGTAASGPLLAVAVAVVVTATLVAVAGPAWRAANAAPARLAGSGAL